MIRKCLVCDSLISYNSFLCPSCEQLMARDRFDNFMVRCDNCFYPLVDKIYDCARCNGDSDHVKIYSEYDYSGYFSRRLLERYKFESERELVKFWAFKYNEMLNKTFVSDENACEKGNFKRENIFLIPIPCSKNSLRKRGWDHMLEITKLLYRKYHFNYIPLITSTNSELAEQKKLKLKERAESAKEKFKINKSAFSKIKNNLEGKVFIILDDIFTTGSTIYACVDLIRSLGVKTHNICAMTAFEEL